VVGLYLHMSLHTPSRTLKAYRNCCKESRSRCGLVANNVIPENGDVDNAKIEVSDQQQFPLDEVVCIPKMFN
jgi:hypothetical protein